MQVNSTELRQMQLIKSMPACAETKASKEAWWAIVRAKYGIPGDVQLKLGLETGTLRDKATGSDYIPTKAPARR